MIPNTEDFIIGLRRMFDKTQKSVDSEGEYLDIVAMELHRIVGYDYKNRNNNRFPSCCEVMRSMMRGKDEILYEPKGRDSSAVVIRYRFPRII